MIRLNNYLRKKHKNYKILIHYHEKSIEYEN